MVWVSRCGAKMTASQRSTATTTGSSAGGAQVLAAEDSPACEQADLGPLPAGTAGKVIAYAEAQLGKPYLWGATGSDAFDCSGLTMMAYRAAAITIPRTSQQQWVYGTRIPASQAQPGDLVFFAGSDGTMTAPGHVGIVTGHQRAAAGLGVRDRSWLPPSGHHRTLLPPGGTKAPAMPPPVSTARSASLPARS